MRRIKKIIAIILILVLLPYITTVFINGKAVEVTSSSMLDEYCIAELAKEVSSEYEDEMLKVQAVIVRTTLYQKINEIEVTEIKNDELDPGWYRRLEKAWKDTAGQVLMYGEELALLPFHYLSNGKTRSGAEVLQSEAYPYLQVRECLADLRAKEQLQETTIDMTGAAVVREDSAGYVLEVMVGEEMQTGDFFRDTHGLASASFDLQSFSQMTRVITKGVGHGLGLSQYTANEMAKEGKTYEEILQYFYEGTEMKEVAEVLWNME